MLSKQNVANCYYYFYCYCYCYCFCYCYCYCYCYCCCYCCYCYLSAYDFGRGLRVSRKELGVFASFSRENLFACFDQCSDIFSFRCSHLDYCPSRVLAIRLPIFNGSG